MAFESLHISVTSEPTIKLSFWIYWADWILALILSLGFVFYFHRLLGFIVSFVFKIFLWRHYKISVNIQSFKVSPLGGRLFMKNLTILTSDMTISIVNLTFTWRYWIFRLNRLSNFYFEIDNEAPEISQKRNDKLPSRFLLVIDGLEVFIYNRTVAYDNIMDILEKNNDVSSSEEKTDQESSLYSDDIKNGNLRFRNRKRASNPSSTSDEDLNSEQTSKGSLSLFFLLQVLPIAVKIKRGAIVIGNVSTPSILVASYKAASGTIDVAKSPNILDPYRLLYDCVFNNFQLWMRPNIGYEKYRYGLEAHHEYPQQPTNENQKLTYMKKYKTWFKYQRATEKLRKLYYKVLGQEKPQNTRYEPNFNWRGLKRYIGDNQDDSEVFAFLNSDVQYAKYSLILDSVATRLIYFYDNPGIQPLQTNLRTQMPPESGIEVEISNGTIHYGPWTDRERVPIQNMLFPPVARDSSPTRGFLKPGSQREYGGFKVTVIVKDEVIIRIPTREPSKDKELIKQNAANNGPTKNSRPFGWLEIKLSEGSNVSTFTSYVAKEDGWPNIMKVNFNLPEIRSSVNHDVLFIADSHEIDAKIGFPLQWNGKCTWEFDQVSLNPKIFFLREHTMLFSDLFTDFGLGDPQPYEYFRLFVYNIKWKLLNYKFYLNVNDLNIVNNPLDFERNKYLSLQGEELDCDINLPLNGLLTKSTTVLFNITTPHFDLVLDTPPWHTVNAFWKESNVVGRSNHFSVDGLYRFFSGIEVNTSDYVEIRCMGDEVSLKFYGFVIRYLFAVRENYFGDNIHFKTFEEYTSQEETQENESIDGTSSQEPNYWKLIKTENDMDVFFTFQVRSGLVMLPYHTYSCQSHIGLNFDMLDIDIRFCNYYMDMQVDFSPISAVFVEDYYSVHDPLLSVNEYVERYFNRKADMHVDGFSVHTHRMFGVPPEELTFYCKWDFCAGDWLVDSSPMFMRGVAGGISNFGVGFLDLENALDVAFPPAFDAANFTFKCPNFTFRLRPDSSSCLEIQLVDFLLSYNDMSNNRYSSKLVVSIPKISLKVLENDMIAAFLNTSLIFTNICQKKDMLGHRDTQQLHVRNSDAPFHRSPFILLEEYRDDFYETSKGCLFTPLSLPNASIPLTEMTFNTSKKLNIDIDTSSISSDSEYAFSNRMPPTNDYLDEEFTPSYKVDPDTEYDSFIVELGDVEAYVSPVKSIEIIISTLQAMEDYSLDTIMDQLNVSTIKFLGSLIHSTETVKNCRIVNHDISIKLGEFLLVDPKELTQQAKKHSTINLQISDLSLALSEKASKTVDEGNITSNEELSLALHIKDILISVAQPVVFNAAVIFTIQEIEYWMELTQDDFTASGNVEAIGFNIDDTQTTWLADGITHIIETIEELKATFEKHSHEINANACLVHALTLASIEYYIDYDPDVLTKPAYILRAKKEHIRFFDSWKVIARLRHILQSLPADWHHEVNNILRDKNYILPENSLEEVTEIFSKWRAWEANQEERRKLLNRIFSGDTANMDKRQMHLQFIFGNISLKLVSSTQTDYIVLQQLSTTVDLNTENERKPVDVVVGLDAYQSNITVLTFDKLKLLQLIKENEKSNIVVEEGESKNFWQHIDLSISIYIEAFSQRVLLSTLILELQGNNLASIATIKEEMKHISNSFTLKNAVCNLWGSSNPVYSQAMENISWVIARTNTLGKELYKVDFELDKVDIHMANKNDKILTILQSILASDIPYVKELLSESESESESKSSSSLNIMELLGCISLKLNIQEFNWRIEILSPLVLEGNPIGCTIGASTIGDDFVFDADFLKGKFSINIDEQNIIEIESSKFVNVIEIGIWENLMLFSVQSSMGYVKLLSPNLISTIVLLDTNLPKLEKKIDSFRDLLVSRELTKHSETTVQEKEFAFKVQFSNDYMGVSTFVNKTKLLFEVESFTLGAYNVDQVENENSPHLQQLVPIYGVISVPAIRISILERSIPIGLSNLFDVNFGIRLLGVDSAGDLQTLQFESQYCRICLSEPIIFKLIKISDEILKVLPKQKAEKVQEEPKDPITEIGSSDLEKLIFSRISTVQFLSYNFCVGWLFNDSSKDYPGIIMGAERFFAATEFKLGKFTLMEAYFSVANGNRSSNFYSTLSQKSNLNRAFLPNLQLSYFIDNNRQGKNLSLSMHGDELDVKFLSTSVAIIEKAVNLASNVQSYLDKRLKPFYQDIEKDVATPHKESLFANTFDSIEFITTFAGSNVLIHRLDNDDSESPASLYLHAPAIKTAIKYLNKKNQGKSKLMGEILTTSSDNTLYSKCMPVVMDIINGTKGLLGKSKKVNSNDLLVEEQPQSSDFIRTILDETDIHFGVRIENQSLSLSCEPTAKVAAIVGLEGIFMQLNTSDSRTPGFNVSVMVDSVSVSLQHIYSRDISASAGIKNILLTNTFEFSEVTRLFSSGSISDADAYINVKQYQDVELFKDIWFPKEYFENYYTHPYPEEEQEESPVDDTFEGLALAQNRNLSSRFKEVSTTYAFPWIVAFVISNVNARVDFGQSLGNFNLHIENFWAVSKKSVDWSQDLKTGVNEVSLTSVGRLGGSLFIRNINLHTGISWKLDLGITLDVPLILVSGGVEELHLKMSFDHHVIAIANFEQFSMDIYNKKSEISIAKDHLFMTTTFKTAEIYVTSLTASNFMDIQNTISRMVQENQRSYKETLRDSSKGKSLEEKKRRRYSENAILETVKKLETRIHVSAGKVLIHIYPSSMDNSKVLVIKLDESRAKFQQNEYSSGISNELDLKFNDLKVSLSSVSPVLEEFVNEASVSELTQNAHKASGGTIFVFPSFRISMRTFQKYNSNLIEYMFQSTFNGTVDIRWNLGSINFIREMYSIHSKSLESRMEYRRKMQPFDEGAGAISKAILEHQVKEEDTTQKIDDAIKETIEKVERSSRFKYSALAPPIIEEPRLKELGNATPPLEWFGLHREKLPHVTHQLAIVSLQKLIHEIELEYSKMLGKA